MSEIHPLDGRVGYYVADEAYHAQQTSAELTEWAWCETILTLFLRIFSDKRSRAAADNYQQPSSVRQMSVGERRPTLDDNLTSYIALEHQLNRSRTQQLQLPVVVQVPVILSDTSGSARRQDHLRELCSLRRYARYFNLSRMDELDGSTEQNPWVLNDAGILVLLNDLRAGQKSSVRAPLRRKNTTHAPPPPRRILNKPRSLHWDIGFPFLVTASGGSASAPPAASRALPTTPRPPAVTATSLASASSRSALVARHETVIREARETITRVRSVPRFVSRYVPPPPAAPSPAALVAQARAGQRAAREGPLMTSELYLHGHRPPCMDTFKEHHQCGLCFGLKAHPVSYKCGHSHCYVCIRISLESGWTCPECSQVMDSAPFHHWGEEASIRADYPDHVDISEVSYSWDGLVFPRDTVDTE
ncbi:hypothetical protein DFH09DRAFT_1332355 [Mycena vulgaris]|nr:hypothetical protein DFH09DRAFT_1332355 [Mycena vulgaris]